HAAEAVLADPDDLLLASHAAVVLAVAAGALADGELVADDPGEVAGGDAEGPLPAQARGHSDRPRVAADGVPHPPRHEARSYRNSGPPDPGPSGPSATRRSRCPRRATPLPPVR